MDFWLICSSFFEKDTVIYKRRQRKEKKKEDEMVNKKEDEKLQIIVHKLNEIPEFANKYDIFLDKLITTYFVRVMRKEKPIQEKYVYSPSIDIEYRTDRGVCFDIEWETMYKRLIVTPKTIFSKYNDFGQRFGKTEYVKNINFDEIDYDDIVKYITETDLIMSFRKDTTPVFLPYNEWRCSKCNSICD